MEEQNVQVIEPAQVEEVAESTPAQEETPVENATAQVEEKPHVPPGLQKRIDQLTREKYEAKREAEYLRQLALQNAPRQEQVSQPQGLQKPTREQFDYDEDRYLEALTDYKVQERLAAQYEQQQVYRQQVEKQQRQHDFSERVQKANLIGAAKYEDYDEVVVGNPNLAVSPVMADALSYSDAGPDIAYHLGKNPEEAMRIYQMPPQLQIMEIARLEAKLKTVPQKRVTAAPSPIEPVGARGVVNVDPDKMTVQEWKKWREEQLRNK